MTILMLVLDIDGVLTDGTVVLTDHGDDGRRVHFHDLDAVGAARRRGLRVAVLSGEDTPSSRRVAARFAIEDATFGMKDKLGGITELSARTGIAMRDICYVGDSDRDAPALEAVGVGAAPADGTPAARHAADVVVDVPGGHGVVAAVMRHLHDSRHLPDELTTE